MAQIRSQWKSPYIFDNIVVQEGGQVLDEYQLEQQRREKEKEERKLKRRSKVVKHKKYVGVNVEIDTEEWFPDFANLKASLLERKKTKAERKLKRKITKLREACDDSDRFTLPDELKSQMTSRSGSFDSGDVYTDEEHELPAERKADLLQKKIDKDLDKMEGIEKPRQVKSKNILHRKPTIVKKNMSSTGM